MYHTGIYARYSTSDQSETSIEDQVRRCRNTIKTKGVLVAREIIFQDSAISGSASAQARRTGYQDLVKAIQSKQINLLIVDEISRISRNSSQIFALKDLIRKHQVRLITVDGIDSQSAEWEILVGLGGILGQEEIENVRFQTIRGMVGQLERGYMLAAPAFGYRRVRVDAAGQPANTEEEAAGTVWEVHPEEAEVVKTIYAEKGLGRSLTDIARMLNQRHVSPPRPKSGVHHPLWLSSTVSSIIRNPIYRGDFVYRGSASYRYSSKKSGGVAENKPKIYPRPHLRLVDDALWHQCNEVQGYTGSKPRSDHLLAGLVMCGTCGGTLSLTSASHLSRALFCPACASRKSVSPDLPALTSSVGVNGVLELLKTVLEQVVADPDVMAAYRSSLSAKLSAGDQQRVAKLRDEIRIQEKAYRRMLDQYIAGDTALEDKVSRLSTEVTTLKEECQSLERRIQVLDPVAIRRQLEITPEEIIRQLLQDPAHIVQLRPILKKLFPVITFRGRTPRKANLFEVQTNIGVAVATATGTVNGDEHLVTCHYSVLASHSRPTTWQVRRLIDVTQ